jgi:hypothetical protein
LKKQIDKINPCFVNYLRDTTLGTFDDDYRHRAVVNQRNFHHCAKTTGLNRDALCAHQINKPLVKVGRFFGFSGFYKGGASALVAIR